MNYHTFSEIKSQTAAWKQAIATANSLADDLKSLITKDYRQVVFTGCGSTYYLSLAGSALYQELTGKVARAVPGGELLLNSQSILTGGDTLLVAVSRSGKTTETVRAVEQFRAKGHGKVIVITNYDSPLSASGDLSLIIPAGQEVSMAQTRSFASMYVAVVAIAAIASGREDLLDAMETLPDIGDDLLRRYQDSAKVIGENLDFDRFYFLGSGGRYGLACEVNLKMKEMTLTHSEPFHFLEFRHGPMSMVNENTLVVGMVSEKNKPHETKVLKEMQALGASTLSLGETDEDISFESSLPESIRGVLYLPILQLMAFYRARAKELDPDNPTNLTAVVQLDFE